MVRNLPGVYSSIFDLSQLPEGAASLPVGIVLRVNKGPMNIATPVANIVYLLNKYIFSGKPSPTDDASIFSAQRILAQTTELYVSRAAKNPLYGGAIVKKETSLGTINSIATPHNIVLSGDLTSSLAHGDVVRVYILTNGNANTPSALNGRYTVNTVTYASQTHLTTIAVSETISASFTKGANDIATLYKTKQPIPFSQESLGAVTAVSSNSFTLAGDVSAFFPAGDKVEVKNSTGNNGIYTVVSAVYSTNTVVTVSEDVPDDTADGTIYRNSIVDPDSYEFKSDDLFIITGVDQGAYNGNIKFEIVSSTESNTLPEANTCQLKVYSGLTNAQLDSTYTFSRDKAAKSMNGTNLYVEDVVLGSNYIKVVDNIAVDNSLLPCSTTAKISLSGGYDGDALSDSDLVAALDVFKDKTLPIVILANGCIESDTYRKAMIDAAEYRGDAIAFINSDLSDEQATLNSDKVSNTITYKKEDIASNSYFATMFTPHVTITDPYNSRKVKIGTDAIAIAQWLKVIREQGYPFAAAGPRYGTLPADVTIDWKIGDQSNEATLLNDASINPVVYSRTDGTYIFWTQNTLQIANSALRDLGVVFNMLDILNAMKGVWYQYLNLPMTPDLNNEMLFKGTNYMEGIKSSGRIKDYLLQDVTTTEDESNDTKKFTLTVAPTKYMQQINLQLNVVASNFDFKILQNA